jgi:hypothetical protein
MLGRATVQLFLAGLTVFLIAPAYVLADGPLPIVRVGIREGGDERITPEEYDAKQGRRPGDFMRKYGATVKLKCPYGWGTANLVLKNDLIVTAAHAFQHRDESDPHLVKCSPVTVTELAQCYVQKLGSDSEPRYPLDVATILLFSILTLQNVRRRKIAATRLLGPD